MKEHLATQIIGESHSTRSLRQLSTKASAIDAPVLIHGEVGTGRQTVARSIHAQSRRAGGPFHWFVCSGLRSGRDFDTLFGYTGDAYRGFDANPGEIALAENGTLYLSHIDEAPSYIQEQLVQYILGGSFLRFGATRVTKANFRIIASAMTDLKLAVTRGTFMRELRELLSNVVLPVEPLRSRKSDICILACHFLAQSRNEKQFIGFSVEAIQWLEAQPWKGNVLELRNTIQRGIDACTTREIGLRDLA